MPSGPCPRHLPARPRVLPSYLRDLARLQVRAACPAPTAPLDAGRSILRPPAHRGSGVPSGPCPRHLPARSRVLPSYLRDLARLQVRAACPAPTAPLDAGRSILRPPAHRGSGVPSGPCPRHLPARSRVLPSYLRDLARLQVRAACPAPTAPLDAGTPAGAQCLCSALLCPATQYTEAVAAPAPWHELGGAQALWVCALCPMARRKVPRGRGCNGRPRVPEVLPQPQSVDPRPGRAQARGRPRLQHLHKSAGSGR